jgi:hypothetical protein
MTGEMPEEFLVQQLGRMFAAYCARPRCGLTKAETYKLVCLECNEAHAKFNLFDPKGANCGMVTIATEDLHTFTGLNWKGLVQWPEEDGK